GAQDQDWLVVSKENERLDDLADLHAEGRRGERGRASRITERLDLDLEAPLPQALSESRGGWMHVLRATASLHAADRPTRPDASCPRSLGADPVSCVRRLRSASRRTRARSLARGRGRRQLGAPAEQPEPGGLLAIDQLVAEHKPARGRGCEL